MAPQQRGKPAATTSTKPDLGDYVQVKDRVREFYQRHPEGMIRTKLFEGNMPFRIIKIQGTIRNPRDGELIMETAEETYILVVAEVRRKSDEEWVTASSMEQFPGRTPYTRNSELENAETSAWGRALAALGIGVDKSMASATEVQNRQAEREQTQYEQAPPTRAASARKTAAAAPSRSAQAAGSSAPTSSVRDLTRSETAKAAERDIAAQAGQDFSPPDFTPSTPDEYAAAAETPAGSLALTLLDCGSLDDLMAVMASSNPVERKQWVPAPIMVGSDGKPISISQLAVRIKDKLELQGPKWPVEDVPTGDAL